MQEEQIVKKKKGRPKKIKPEESNENLDNNNENLVKEKKKRGRKKKEVPVQQEDVPKQKKKRGRKTAVKYFSSSIRKKIPLTTVIKDNDNYILHIDIKDNLSQNNNEDVINENDIQEEENFQNNTNKTFQKHPVIDSLPKEIKDILNNNDDNTNDDDLFSNIIDLDNEEESNQNIKDLYIKRLEFREKQDQVLSVKLEEMHKDENFINQLIEQNENQELNNVSELHLQDEFEKLKIKTQESNKKKGFFEMLYDFVHNEEWLHKTDVCCWWCCHSFNTIPLGLPFEYNKKTNKFMVKGIFCSFACMLAYKNENKLQDKNYLINYLYTKLTADTDIINSETNKLKPAPSKYTLKMFGGELSIEEFRNASNENKVYKMIEYPMSVYNDYVEEIDIENIKNANSKLFNKEALSKLTNLDDKRVHDAQTRLSQLEPTVITSGNTIDKFIKFS